MKIAWLTDIHLDFVPGREIEKLIAGIRSTGADAVLITGDIATAPFLCSHLENLAAKIRQPIYFVLGNHDYYGSSIRRVNSDVSATAARVPNLVWLSGAGVVKLTTDACLIGHEGLADGRLGNPFGSEVQLNDYYQIEELKQPTKVHRLQVQNRLGDDAAAYLRQQLDTAISAGYQQILVALHVPPFAEACWYEGQLTNTEFLPHFSCKATGDALKAAMETHPQISLAVYCGHTHSSGYAEILPNLRIFTAGAEYRSPGIAKIIEL